MTSEVWGGRRSRPFWYSGSASVHRLNLKLSSSTGVPVASTSSAVWLATAWEMISPQPLGPGSSCSQLGYA